MPSIAALDDWHYLKSNSSIGSYLECTYIFDCLSREAGLTNTQLRQWFVMPLSAEQQASIEQKRLAEISIVQKTSQPTTLFATTKSIGSSDKQLIPSLDIYSWEKAFYGVENDQGLTCPRYDKIVPKRNANWTIQAQGKSEELSGIDVNVRLIHVDTAVPLSTISTQPNYSEIDRMTGKDSVTLKLDKTRLNDGQLMGIGIKLAYAPTYLAQVHFTEDLLKSKPQLKLSWLDHSGKKQTMKLPWLPKPNGNFALLVPLDLKQLDGSQFGVSCDFPDKDCQIELSSHILDCHPLRSKQELF